MTAEVLELLLHRNATLVESAMKECYSEDEDLKILLDAERYSLFAGGKRIRPTLTLEFCKLFGGDEEKALPFACAVEMVHTYSLIHDDLPCMDNDDLRRGKPTNHKVFGEQMAILAGDSLLTGALINAAAVMGALAAGVGFTDPRMQDAYTYAENIGLAFQVIDDILDATGDAASLGKNVGTDAARQKNTFLSFYTVEKAQAFAEMLTEEAVQAIGRYPQSEALVALAKWLASRKH